MTHLSVRSLLSSVLVASLALAGCMDVGIFEDDSLQGGVICPASIPKYAVGVAYKVGDFVSFNGQVFKVITAHTSQADWPPNVVPALYQPVTCDGNAAPPAPPALPAPPAPPAPPPTGAAKTTYAPYFFAFGWNNAAFPFRGLVDMRNKSGLNAASLAFVLARGGACAATTDVFDNLNDVKAFVAGGGKLKASFGGAFGTYLENACASSGAMAAVINDFVARTGITDLDFDVEQTAAETPAINNLRALALKQVQQANPAVKISLTVPSVPRDRNGNPGGMSAATVGVVKAVVQAGVKVTYVNLMTMDFGPFFEIDTMGKLAISALTDAQVQIKQIFAISDDATAFRMLGVTPMIGVNDSTSEVFRLSDVATLTAFVKARGVGLVSFWGINRDQSCGVLANCSLLPQAAFDFNKAFTNGLK